MNHDYEVKRICVEAYLRHVRRIRADLRKLEDGIRIACERMELCGVSYDSPIAGGGEHDQVAKAVIALQESREEYAAAYLGYESEIRQAERLLDNGSIGSYALKLHYIDGLTWGKTATKLGYSERAVRYKAADAINEIYCRMPEEFRRNEIPNAEV